MGRGSTVISLLVSVAACGCGHRWPALDLSRLPSAADHPGATGVVLLDETTVAFHEGELGHGVVIDVTEHRTVRILAPGGDHLAQVVTFFQPSLETLTEYAVRTVAPGGAGHEYGRQQAFDKPANPGFVLYGDQRALVLHAQPNGPGTVVESRVTYRYREPRIFAQAMRFDGELPVRTARLVVTHPAAWRIETLARALGQPADFPARIATSGGITEHVWERHDQPALPREPLGPERAGDYSTSVAVRLAAWREGGQEAAAPRDARELSTFVHQLQKPSHLVTDALRDQAHTIVAGLEAPADKARRLYTWVRDHVTYCAVEVGMGGWIPHSPDDVRRLGYGDCKDKANYLRSLLAAEGVPSVGANVWLHRGLPHPFGLPTLWGNFNHQILVVNLPEGDVICDPTSRTVPWGELPAGDQGAEILPIAPEGAPLRRTPISPPESNSLEARYQLQLSPDGSAAGSYTLEATGAEAEERRSALVVADRRLRADEATAGLELQQAYWRSEPRFEQLAPPELPRPVTVRGEVVVKQVLGGNGSTRVLRPSDLLARWVAVLPGGRRLTPVVHRFRRHRRQELELALPPGFEVVSLPEAVIRSSPLGRYRLEWKAEGNRLSLERELWLLEPVVPPADYPALKDLFDGILAAEARPAVLRAPNP